MKVCPWEEKGKDCECECAYCQEPEEYCMCSKEEGGEGGFVPWHKRWGEEKDENPSTN